jgi:hypothetical protein
MADPTKSARRAVGEILPGALGDSLEKQYQAEDQQIAVDEANNLVEQRDPANLPPEASAFANPTSIPTRSPSDLSTGEKFVDPASAQAAQANAQTSPSLKVPVASVNGLNMEANAVDKLGKEQAGVYGELGKGYAAADAKTAELEKQEESLVEKYNREKNVVNEEIASFKREPHSVFSGKSTWQKVVGGIGMFLGSITPEGAKNVANIINTEIDRDIKRQEASFQLLKDKSGRIDNAYAQNMARFKDKKLAQIATKQNMLSAADLKLKQLESSSKGDLARAKATQGREEIAREMNKTQMEFDLKAQELGLKEGKGALPGFEGSNSNPAIVKDLTERVTAKASAEKQISNLERLMNEGAKNPLGSNNAVAEATRKSLAADLAKAMFGRSSDTELEVAMSLIPDITSITRRDSTSIKMLNALKAKLNSDVDSAATAAGFKRKLPTGAVKK